MFLYDLDLSKWISWFKSKSHTVFFFLQLLQFFNVTKKKYRPQQKNVFVKIRERLEVMSFEEWFQSSI